MLNLKVSVQWGIIPIKTLRPFRDVGFEMPYLVFLKNTKTGELSFLIHHKDPRIDSFDSNPANARVFEDEELARAAARRIRLEKDERVHVSSRVPLGPWPNQPLSEISTNPPST